VMRTMLAAAASAVLVAGALAVPFSVVMASPASAAPCSPGMPHGITSPCTNCIDAAGQDMGAQYACMGYAPVTNAPSPWADCNALQLPSDRGTCNADHIAGRR
jgi:hypothetical protein